MKRRNSKKWSSLTQRPPPSRRLKDARGIEIE
jgi:hypothetical protein